MTILKLNAKGDSVRLLQELLQQKGYDVPVDGVFSKGTEDAVKAFQLKNNLISDGIAGIKTWTILQNLSTDTFAAMQSKYLSEQDLIDLASQLGIPVAAVKCVYEVESSGRGFLTDGRPKILFEGHVFWKQLKSKNIEPKNYIPGNEDILYPKWTKEFYKGGPAEYDRLEKAKKIHEDAALESASWGIFQIMGYHYPEVGYNSVKDFVDAQYQSERNHLMAFGKFIESEGLVKYLKNCDWARFAYRYNGAGYEENKYDSKLAAAYKKYSTAA
ncbi:MAG TPA: N-acetylmuramidase family protein [Ignavibacteriaceae bacterium]|nr:N-acetylmuramidase family protein [Ignavibacteriaceae bacterium]